MDTLLKILGAVLLCLVLVVVIAAIGAYPTKWIVNYLFAPSALQAVFGIPRFDFWHAFFLDAFCGMAFSSPSSSDKK